MSLRRRRAFLNPGRKVDPLSRRQLNRRLQLNQQRTNAQLEESGFIRFRRTFLCRYRIGGAKREDGNEESKPHAITP